jgi:hypothetical protein
MVSEIYDVLFRWCLPVDRYRAIACAAGVAVGIVVAVVVVVVVVVVAPWGTSCARHRRADPRYDSAAPLLHREINGRNETKTWTPFCYR